MIRGVYKNQLTDRVEVAILFISALIDASARASNRLESATNRKICNTSNTGGDDSHVIRAETSRACTDLGLSITYYRQDCKTVGHVSRVKKFCALKTQDSDVGPNLGETPQKGTHAKTEACDEHAQGNRNRAGDKKIRAFALMEDIGSAGTASRNDGDDSSSPL